MGFQRGGNIVERPEDGIIFLDIIQEFWKHQFVDCNIISFWGALDSIVPRESALLGYPTHQEAVVKLNADHSTIFKFGPSQRDQVNFKIVRRNIKNLYEMALQQTRLATLATGFSSQNFSLRRIRPRNLAAEDLDSRSISLSASASPPPSLKPSRKPSSTNLSAIQARIIRFTFHQTTLITVLLLFGVISGMMLAFAMQQMRKTVCNPRLDMLLTDDGFWTLMSQLFLQGLAIYCTLCPVVLDREQKIPVAEFWFKVLLAVSLVTAIVAAVVYAWSWKAATVLSFVSGFAQVIAAAQLAASLGPDDKSTFSRTKTFNIEDDYVR